MCVNNIDVRIINLYKLHIPKTKSFVDLAGATDLQLRNHKYYFTMGNYDLVDIMAAPIESDGEHILSQIHNMAEKRKCNSDGDTIGAGNASGKEGCIAEDEFSNQRLYVFTGADEQKRNKINQFWDTGNSENDDHLFFVSMLHINDYSDGRIDLESAIKHIERCYSGLDYLYYFTLDYSDIIIFCKTKTVDLYLEAINKLNYDSGTKKIVRDSFTIYGICRRYMLDQFTKIKEILANTDAETVKRGIEIFLKGDKEDSSFFLKINIGVQNYKTLEYFRNKLEKLLEYCGDSRGEINQLGRHDFSLINDKATLKWLILAEYLIDLCTTVGTDTSDEPGMHPGNKITSSDVFWTFEAFVGGEVRNYNDIRVSEGLA